jgi:hypothetical protein
LSIVLLFQKGLKVVQNKRMKSRGSSNRSIAFSRLFVQLVGGCRHKYYLQQAVCTAGVLLQTEVLSSIGCLYSWWTAADTSTVFTRLSAQLVGSCRHEYCLQEAVCTVGGQLQTQVLPSAGYLYSWWAATDTSTVFSRLSVQLVSSCRHKYCLQQAVCTVGVQLDFADD